MMRKLAVTPMRDIWSSSTPGSRGLTLWRYYQAARFRELIASSVLYFTAATQFIDPFEGAVRVIPADAPSRELKGQALSFNHFLKNWRRSTKISCWHIATHESDAMWQLYAERNKGVALRTTLARIRAAIKPLYVGRDLVVPMWCGRVRYLDLTQERVPPPSDVPVGVIKRFYFKHKPFQWENEYRLLFDLHGFRSPIPEHGVLVSVDLNQLIEAIVLGPHLTTEEIESITAAARSASLADRIVPSTMLGTPTYI